MGDGQVTPPGGSALGPSPLRPEDVSAIFPVLLVYTFSLMACWQCTDTCRNVTYCGLSDDDMSDLKICFDAAGRDVVITA